MSKKNKSKQSHLETENQVEMVVEENEQVEEVTAAVKPVTAKRSKGLTLTNTGKRKHMLGGKTLDLGQSIELTEKQMVDESLMAKVKTSIRCGVLTEAK